MISRNMTIKIPSGLEARPVALLVQVASQYESKIQVVAGDKKINAKSIMGMMSLGLAEGEDLTVIADGDDEQTAIDHIERYLSTK
ncbi:MAG: HPr family phosphocarrier protein [Lachnospiraceae bacterium]|nr:HPr family phosphocarrier protein [Lachnospiraceae bacterium]